MRILALDVGDKRIGLAVSDPTGVVATSLLVYERRAQAKDIAEMLRLAAAHQADAFLVGIPVSLNGSLGEQALRTQRFREALAAASPIPVLTCDERFTSVEADRLMQGSGVSRAKRRGMRDAAAAAVFLQSYLDTQALARREPKSHSDTSPRGEESSRPPR